jgi:hypothetical protein
MPVDGPPEPDGDDPGRHGDRRPDKSPDHGGSGGRGTGVPMRPTETRNRAEYYDALRAADGYPAAEDGDIVNETEIIERAEALPGRFADRLPVQTLESLRLMEAGGEYGELAIELAATLAARSAPVTAEERDESRDLLTAMGMPTDPIAKLNVPA